MEMDALYCSSCGAPDLERQENGDLKCKYCATLYHYDQTGKTESINNNSDNVLETPIQITISKILQDHGFHIQTGWGWNNATFEPYYPYYFEIYKNSERIIPLGFWGRVFKRAQKIQPCVVEWMEISFDNEIPEILISKDRFSEAMELAQLLRQEGVNILIRIVSEHPIEEPEVYDLPNYDEWPPFRGND